MTIATTRIGYRQALLQTAPGKSPEDMDCDDGASLELPDHRQRAAHGRNRGHCAEARPGCAGRPSRFRPSARRWRNPASGSAERRPAAGAYRAVRRGRRPPQFNIRGVQLYDQESATSCWWVYVDEIYMGHARRHVSELLDVERVEVLRARRGRCSGRNTTGGLVHIVAQVPQTNAFMLNTSLQYGAYDQVIAEGAVGGPEVDTVRRASR